MATEVGPVDLHRARQVAVRLLRADGLAELVSQDKGCLVLDIQVTAELEGGNALDRVHEDRDGSQIVPHRQLTAGEDGSAGDAELVIARLALPDATGCVAIDFDAAATRAERVAVVVGEANRNERRMSLIIRHTKNRLEAQRSGCGREKEVLCHGSNPNAIRWGRAYYRIVSMSTKNVGITCVTRYHPVMLAPEQSRAGRAWLEWSQEDLAMRANVSLSTVRDFEKGRRVPIGNNLLALAAALKHGGVTPTYDEQGRPNGVCSRVAIAQAPENGTG